MKTYHDLVDEAKQKIREVSVSEVREMRDRGDKLVLVDIREPKEWNLGRIPGAVFAPRGELEKMIEGIATREDKVVLYCASGARSALGALTLGEMGFKDVASMAGGWRDWASSGGDVEG